MMHFGLFYYLMNLHYSQTMTLVPLRSAWFYYLMNLHYSQTPERLYNAPQWFYYLMNLHYSQTSNKLRPLYSAGQIHKI